MIIIPARLNSTRFENKILAKFGEVPMFIKTAQNCTKADKVVIACDDEKVAQIAQNFGFKAVLTDINHKSGTDRINEAATKLNLNENEIIINVQADEPFFELENISNFKHLATKALENGFFMASCYKLVDKNEALDPNLVKVVIDDFSKALYFSRSLIPFDRDICKEYKAHIGIYAFNTKTLREFCTLPNSSLEDIEKLEQLRALQNGKKIAMFEVKSSSFGIDTLQDYQRALKL